MNIYRPYLYSSYQHLRKRANYLLRTLHIIWQTAPAWTFAWMMVLCLQGMLPVGMVYLTKPLVDGLSTALPQRSWQAFHPLLGLLVCMAVLLLLIDVFQSGAGFIRSIQTELVQNRITRLIHEKSISVDLTFYESADYYDQFHRARNDAYTRPLALLDDMGRFIQHSITLLGMSTLLLPFGIWLPLALAASTLPGLLVAVRYNQHHHTWYRRTTADRRWANYYDWRLTDGEGAAELRLFGLGTSFMAAFRILRERLLHEQIGLQREQIIGQMISSCISLLIVGLAMLVIIQQALNGLMTLGQLLVFYQIFDRGQILLRSLLSSMASIYSHSLFLSDLFAFLDLQPQVIEPSEPIAVPQVTSHSVRFHQISFQYPGSERVALENFDLNIPAGQVVAIVGPNGAGKSTLVKLLCRFYDPTAGSVEIDGIDIRKFALNDLRRLITVLFQMPQAYHATAGENIAISDLEHDTNQQAIEGAAKAAGAHEVITRLPQTYNTLLGRWFADGAELSGGEWLRVALARAFLRRSPIVILDEPTSFMDSWAENEWLERFRTLVKGRTTLIISHRFTTAMRADIIYVVDQGRVVESGSHQELLQLGGLYAVSWQAQMEASEAPEYIPSSTVLEFTHEVLA